MNILNIANISESACARMRLSLKQRLMFVKTKHLNSPSQQAFQLQDYLASRSAAVNQALDEFLPAVTVKPATIHRAMRYSLFAGGKCIRPALCLAAAAACGGDEADAYPLA